MHSQALGSMRIHPRTLSDQCRLLRSVQIASTGRLTILIGMPISSSGLDYQCSRFDQSFPKQLNADQRLPGQNRQLQFLACTADKATDVLPQIDQMSASTDMITLTIGGNDVGFGSIVNGCIYFLYPTTWTCEQLIDFANSQIASADFSTNYLNVIQGMYRKAPAAQVYILGYPAFFNAVCILTFVE